MTPFVSRRGVSGRLSARALFRTMGLVGGLLAPFLGGGAVAGAQEPPATATQPPAPAKAATPAPENPAQPPAPRADAVALEWKFREGDRLVYRVTNTTTMEGAMPMFGGGGPEEGHGPRTERILYILRIIKVDAAGDALAEVTVRSIGLKPWEQPGWEERLAARRAAGAEMDQAMAEERRRREGAAPDGEAPRGSEGSRAGEAGKPADGSGAGGESAGRGRGRNRGGGRAGPGGEDGGEGFGGANPFRPPVHLLDNMYYLIKLDHFGETQAVDGYKEVGEIVIDKVRKEMSELMASQFGGMMLMGLRTGYSNRVHQQELREWFALCPKEKKSPGDSWEAAFVEVVPLLTNVYFYDTLTLKAVKDGAAEIAVDRTVSPARRPGAPAGGMQVGAALGLMAPTYTDSKVAGEARFDVAHGHLLSSRKSRAISFAMTLPGSDRKMDLALRTETRVDFLARFSGRVAEPRPRLLPPPPPAPVPAPAPAPAAPAPAPKDDSGEF